jgi:hypothetical protein
MISDGFNTLALRVELGDFPSALLHFPREIYNDICQYAFCVDRIQGTQYKAPAAGKTNNEYNTFTSKYSMTLETRDSSN